MLIPDHETAVDFLNYEAIAGTTIELLNDNRERALSIGIHGDWGAGKSSVLKMVEDGLAGEGNVACLWFNGWAFQGFDDAKTVLIEAIISELARQRSTYGKVKDMASSLLKRVDWLKVAKRGSSLAFTLATGIPSPDLLDSVLKNIRSTVDGAKDLSPEEIEAKIADAASYLKDAEASNVPDQVYQFREDFSKLLEEAKIEQLVVLIDDLDRCLPATAIDTLEAIRLFLFVPKTAFVIGADETMIEYAVRQHFPDMPLASGPVPYARNYLEKLIQVPFRIPALGTQETRAYVTLLLVESLVGESHAGFQTLLKKAKDGLNRPWLGTPLTQSDVADVDSDRKDDLISTFVLAQQIGPILAEGTKGNPRQIKRFLNALLVRQAIARARHFSDQIQQPALAKLMLAERFQPDFYEEIARMAMTAEEGLVGELHLFEERVRGEEKKTKSTKKPEAEAEEPTEQVTAELIEKWCEREWLKSWAKIAPPLGNIDLRPYAFVARDKKILSVASDLNGFDGLVEKLSGSALSVRSVETEVKALQTTEAQQVFDMLREQVLRQGTYQTEPKGFQGLSIVAKHHIAFQSDLVSLIGSIDPTLLGMWVVKGWNEILTQPSAQQEFQNLLTRWSRQDDNKLLKQAAGKALPGWQKGGR
ncbi:MAG: Qat anti-phage system ATPase QatA [Candidatus Thiodiazotropha endolucinida]